MFEWFIRLVVWGVAALFLGISAVCLAMDFAFCIWAGSVIDKKRGQPVNYLFRKRRSDINALEKIIATETDPAEKQRFQQVLDRMHRGRRLTYLGVLCLAVYAALHLYLTVWSR